MQIIPAIDIIDGKCVRLTEGDYQQKTEYSASPLEMAKIYEQNGISRLHLVDLDGAKTGKVTNWKVAEEIAANTNLVIDFGGGVKTKEEVERIFDMGIAYTTVGSMAAKSPEVFKEWIAVFGPHRFMLGADVKDEMIMVSGWFEQSTIHLLPFIASYMEMGISNVFCTDISKDGRLEGPSTALYAKIKKQFPALFLIASGGVAVMDDLHKLELAGCDGAIIGKAIYENRISIESLKAFNEKPPTQC
jgi:phosphoribosylformimino-5-aminoimidazole carboxamide ribotide isomerase